jgi:DNA-directed RNA polymerase specialized sigma24 family protein
MKSKSFEPSNPLGLFSADPEIAEREYADLRKRLVRFFQWNRTDDAEDLADETLFRVFRSLQEGRELSGSLQQYAHGIAKYVVKERRVRKAEELPESAPAHDAGESLSVTERTLLAAELLSKLSKDDRSLLTSYFVEDRNEAAARFGLSGAALRLRVHRILERLRRVASKA